MKTISIEPFRKCGPIKSGDSYFDIVKKFSDHQEFKKSPLSKFITSSIMNGGLHVYYSEKGVCTGVEVFPPLKPFWDGVDLFSLDLKHIENLLGQREIEIEISDTGLEVLSLGISLFSHDFDQSVSGLVDSVYVDFTVTCPNF